MNNLICYMKLTISFVEKENSIAVFAIIKTNIFKVKSSPYFLYIYCTLEQLYYRSGGCGSRTKKALSKVISE